MGSRLSSGASSDIGNLLVAGRSALGFNLATRAAERDGVLPNAREPAPNVWRSPRPDCAAPGNYHRLS
ncbi:hypothetical protein ACFPRL_12990 [Pseudoclavibacter helvolus]